MSGRPQFNFTPSSSPAAPITSKEQASAIALGRKQFPDSIHRNPALIGTKRYMDNSSDTTSITDSGDNTNSNIDSEPNRANESDICEDEVAKITSKEKLSVKIENRVMRSDKQMPENLVKGATCKNSPTEDKPTEYESMEDKQMEDLLTQSDTELSNTKSTQNLSNKEATCDKKDGCKSSQASGKKESGTINDADSHLIISAGPSRGSQSGATEDDVHTGALRRHSIEAMKELGTPESPTIAELPFDFPKFMDCLRHKSADPIARYIKSFLQEFGKCSWTPQQQEKIVADFQKFINLKLKDYEPFASMSKSERRNSLEGIEKLIMTRLYTKTFPPKMPPILRTDDHNEDLLKDQIFEEKMRLWSWLEGRHLDINDKYLQSNFVTLATSELGRLHLFKSPRDKMICILNCSKVIYALIKEANLESNADSFLPLLIYVVIKAHPLHLVSTLHYIQRFRAREFSRGETAYYLSTLESAVTFLETLDKSSLTISDDEFELRMSEAVQAEKNRLLDVRAQAEQDNDTPNEGAAGMITASAGILVDRMRKLTTKLWEDSGSGDEAQHLQEQDNYDSQSRNQEQVLQDASQEEFMSNQVLNEQFNETLDTLKCMFPLLDREIIEDVLRQNGSNVGSAVDICLELVK